MRGNCEICLQSFSLKEEEGMVVGSWEDHQPLFARIEVKHQLSIYAEYARGSRHRTCFRVREELPITPNYRIYMDGNIYHIYSVVPHPKDHLEILGVQVHPVSCTAHTQIEGGESEEKEPEYIPTQKVYFPAIVSEKYQDQSQGEPMAYTQKTLVLVTPKEILLQTSDLVAVGEEQQPYMVQLGHTLGEYQNEYEVTKRIEYHG